MTDTRKPRQDRETVLKAKRERERLRRAATAHPRAAGDNRRTVTVTIRLYQWEDTATIRLTPAETATLDSTRGDASRSGFARDLLYGHGIEDAEDLGVCAARAGKRPGVFIRDVILTAISSENRQQQEGQS